jgi:hypothetical protein
MIEPADEGSHDHPSPYRSAETPSIQYGEVRTCELCGKERECIERCDLVVCQACQETFLPSKGLFL